MGYATGQFGKNHFGDRDEHLPTMHGFDEFFGNLYHLNAEEEPEDPDYPKDPEFRKKFGPRGVLHCKADGKGGQTIEDTGPLTKKRMETIDDEVTEHALRFIDEAHKADKPFFLWYNTTAMHFRTHCAEKHKGKSGGQGDYNDVMVAHDENIGMMLDKLDELGIADDTIVMYSTDNGVHYNTWPDAGITPFRSEKNTNWEGGWRVPCFVRWPGKFKAGTVLNGIVTHQDWLATFLAAAGEPDIKEKLLKGHKAGKKTFKVHIDGFNMLPYLKGEVKESPRNSFFYISDDGDILAIRMQDWKVVLMEQRAKQTGVLGRAVREAADPEDVPPAARPVRAGRRELEHLLGLVDLPRLHHLRDAGGGRQPDRELREVPAAAEAGLVQPGRRDARPGNGRRRRQPLSCAPDPAQRRGSARL